MASTFHGKKLLHFWFFVLLGLWITEVTAETSCPQQPKGEKSEVSVNERAQKLEGTSTFEVYDKEKRYLYTITLCRKKDVIAVRQQDLKKINNSYKIGYFDGAHLVGGRDWLMITYYGEKYGSHCGGTPRRSIFFIQCDQSATTEDKRRPKFVEEYAPPGKKPDESLFCYYLFEMKHSAACQELPKTKISPGSVFIIIVVVVGVLYLVLGFLYQRFIVGAKGLEQIPNYLMWREFGTLQADGCNFMCRCKSSREATRYKPMDDAIADDDDENEDKDDDTLLPM